MLCLAVQSLGRQILLLPIPEIPWLEYSTVCGVILGLGTGLRFPKSRISVALSDFVYFFPLFSRQSLHF